MLDQGNVGNKTIAGPSDENGQGTEWLGEEIVAVRLDQVKLMKAEVIRCKT